MTLEKAERYNNAAVGILDAAIFIMAASSFLFGSPVAALVFILYGQVVLFIWMKLLLKDEPVKTWAIS